MNPQITNDKPEKIKDPKKVEQGKILAAISKDAKEKNRCERLEVVESQQRESQDGCNYWYLVGLVGITTAAFGVYFSLRPDKSTTVKTPAVSETTTKESSTSSTSEPNTTGGVLESFD